MADCSNQLIHNMLLDSILIVNCCHTLVTLWWHQ